MTDEHDPIVITKAPWWMESFKTLGLPTMFLLALLYMIWKSGSWAATTVIVPLFEKQVQFIEESSAMTQKMSETVESIDATISAQGQHASEMMSSHRAMREAVDTNLKAIHATQQVTTINQDFLKRQEKASEEIVDILQSIDATLKKTNP